MQRWTKFVSIFTLLACATWLPAQAREEVRQEDSQITTSAAPPVAAQKNPKSAENTKKAAKVKRPLNVTPEREAAVMTFVQRNHAELADLLLHLKSSQPEEYERAIRDLFRTTERLALIHERDPLQYELELAAWTAQSRVQLLAARLKMGVTDELRDQLRAALALQGEARLALLSHERQNLSDRLTKVESDITRYGSDRDKVIDKQLQSLLRAANQGRTAKITAKNAGKNAAKSSNKKNNSPPVSQPTATP